MKNLLLSILMILAIILLMVIASNLTGCVIWQPVVGTPTPGFIHPSAGDITATYGAGLLFEQLTAIAK